MLQESYYLPRGGARRNHGGKIVNKIGNLKQKKRKSEIKEDQHLKKIKPEEPTDGKTEISQQSIEANEWLALNDTPWSTVLDKWSISFESRKQLLGNKKTVTKILKVCGHFKNPHGFQLVSN